MNERIKELAVQAGCSIDGMGFGEGDIEGLVKLIVKECAEVAADHDALDIYEEIREHFGVQE